MAGNGSSENLRVLYDHSSTQFRFYLIWRQLLMAGYFAVFASFCAAIVWMLQNLPLGAVFVGAIGIAVSVLFYFLDVRNRQLYEIASQAATEIEELLGRGLGYFQAYHSKKVETEGKKWKHRHRRMLKYLYWGGAFLMFVIFALSLANALGKLKIASGGDKPTEIMIVKPSEIKIQK